MKNNILIKINCSNVELLIKRMFFYEIELYNIKEEKDCIKCFINAKDLNKISKLYEVEVLLDKRFLNMLHILKKKIDSIVLFIIAIIFFILLSNIIVDVKIISNNTSLVNDLYKVLDEYDIKRLSFKKHFIDILNIKNEIEERFKDRLEWIEIEQLGMTYNIKLEERKKEISKINSPRCNVVAKSEGIITKIISTDGNILVKKNQMAKEGDLLITGHITLNDEEKTDICANGLVYAEKWYNVSIEIPITYEKKEYTGKIRNNLLFEMDNRDYKIFKSRLKNYDSDKKEIISLLGKKLYLLKEYEYNINNYKYSEEELDKKTDELVIEKLNLSLNEDEKILQKKVLKKDENDSRINIELFVIVEELISKQISY